MVMPHYIVQTNQLKMTGGKMKQVCFGFCFEVLLLSLAQWMKYFVCFFSQRAKPEVAKL